MQNTEWVPEKLKGAAFFLAWLAGLFLIAGLAWFLSRPVRADISMRNINTVLKNARELRQLEAPLADKSIPRLKAAKAAQLGTWYSLHNSEDRAVVFSIMTDGILAPYLLFVSPRGEMGEPIPLGAHSAQMLERLPREVLQTYRKRLLAGDALLSGEKK
ncbi:hypothetical protein AGMMS49942_04350 [Spirochaetia bacterium]|nr:hypothetical protein AGMMS49942_04350 [Spirochaetia bacterium]